jgi:hypothetical protein
MCVATTVAFLWQLFTVFGFCSFIITAAMAMLLQEAFDLYVLLCEYSGLKQKTVYSFMVCYVHVLLYSAAARSWLLPIYSLNMA